MRPSPHGFAFAIIGALCFTPHAVLAHSQGDFSQDWSDQLRQARDGLLCVRLAGEPDRSSLPIAVVDTAAKDLTPSIEDACSGDPGQVARVPSKDALRPRDPNPLHRCNAAEHASHYVFVLGLLAHFANLSGDPQLEHGIRADIVSFARGNDLLPRVLQTQLQRCAAASQLAAAIELDNRDALSADSAMLAALYSKAPVGPDAEDWPLVLALRELSLVGRTSLEELRRIAAAEPSKRIDPAGTLIDVAESRARMLRDGRPLRAARLFSAAAQAALAQGNSARAADLVKASSELGATASDLAVRWGTFPVRFDSLKAAGRRDAAYQLARTMATASPLSTALEDRDLWYEIHVRLAEAELSTNKDAARELWLHGWSVMSQGTAPFSLYRRALADSVAFVPDPRMPTNDELDKLTIDIAGFRIAPGPSAIHRLASIPIAAEARNSLSKRVPRLDLRERLVFFDEIDREMANLSKFYLLLPERLQAVRPRAAAPVPAPEPPADATSSRRRRPTHVRGQASAALRERSAGAESRPKVADLAFRLVQVRGFHGIGSASKYQMASRFRVDIAHALDPEAKVGGGGTRGQDLERSFMFEIMFPKYLRNHWERLRSEEGPQQTRDASGRRKAPARGRGRYLPASRDTVDKLRLYFLMWRGGSLVAGKRELMEAFDFKPRPLNDYQSFLGEEDGILAAVPTDHGLFVWGITREGAIFQRVDVGAKAVDSLARRLRASLVPVTGGDRLKTAPFDAAASYELYRMTLGTVRDHLRGKKHLYWYGSAELAAIPPAILIDEQPPQDLVSSADQLRHLGWIGDRYSVSVLPDLSVLATQRDAPARTRAGGRAFLGIGATLLTMAELQTVSDRPGSEGLAGGLDGKALRALPKLPETANELRNLAFLFDADRSLLLLGPMAAKPSVLRELSAGASVVAFATHGFLANEIADVPDPALLLAIPADVAESEGVLTSIEIAGVHTGADLVILSACNTATSDGRPRGETFSGLTTSFTVAGARALLVSHWPVASGAAAAISVRTVERSLREHVPLADSLQRTMRELRDDPAGGDLQAHPFYWAPFVLVGDGMRSL
jgi:CHAT domain-containing protein